MLVGNADDPTAKATFYIPSAYQVGTPAPGTKLGDVTATASPPTSAAPCCRSRASSTRSRRPPRRTPRRPQCGVSPTQTWDLHLTAAGQTLDIPMFVGRDARVPGYSIELVVCLPPPDVPTGTPGRATFGAKLLSATFTSSAITQPSAAGDYRWTSLWTPYNPGQGHAERRGLGRGAGPPAHSDARSS